MIKQLKCRLSRWLKRQIWNLLGLEDYRLRIIELERQVEDYRKMLDLYGEILANPEHFKIENTRIDWKSPSWKTSKKTWLVAINREHDYYTMFHHLTNDLRERDYGKKSD